ncbi:MAG: hypothetical protein GY870_00805 [archaeon]|nr:hypothetical protein [archaeon]
MDIYQYQALWNTAVTLFLFISAVIFFYIAIRGLQAKNYYGGISTLISALILVFFTVYNNVFLLFEWPFYGFLMYWAGVLLAIHLIFWAIVFYNENKKQKNKTNSELADLRSEDKYSDRNFYHKQISLNMEYYRKSFHLLGLLVIIATYGIGNIIPLAQGINDFIVNFIEIPVIKDLYNDIWLTTDIYPYTIADQNSIYDLTLFGLFGAYVFACFSEFIRILVGAKYALFNRLTKSVLRGKEYKSMGPHLYLIIGMTFSFLLAHIGLFPYEIVIAACAVSCFSDALAAVVGRRFGRHKITLRNKETKTLEGFIVGAGSAYFFALFFIGPFYALFAAVIFFLVDYFPISVADNLLNPILISTGLTILYIMSRTPIVGFL